MPAPIDYVMSAFSYLIYGWVIKWLRRGMKETSSARIAMFDIPPIGQKGDGLE